MLEPPITGPLRTMSVDFGDGWMTHNACDMARILIAFLPISPEDLILTIARIHKGKGRVNTATVERAIAMMEASQ